MHSPQAVVPLLAPSVVPPHVGRLVLVFITPSFMTARTPANSPEVRRHLESGERSCVRSTAGKTAQQGTLRARDADRALKRCERARSRTLKGHVLHGSIYVTF